MLEKILSLFAIACAHRHLSKPFTAAAATAHRVDWDVPASGPSHYVVCLDCGKKFAYDWSTMRVVR